MLLSLDSSAVTASVALTDGDRVIKSEFVNSGLTHSETLLPMVKRVMGDNEFSSLDAVAITAGPGSFTGVSTLEAIAYNFVDENCVVCAVMDARRMQFYNAIFKVENGIVSRITPDRAISIDDLREELKQYDSVIIAGDGAALCSQNIALDNCKIAADDKIYQNALSVAKCVKNKKAIAPSALMPVYLRQSQAERELKLKR